MEYEAVLIRPDELFLKSEPVRHKMMKQLAHNVKVALKAKDVTYDQIVQERLYILVKGPESEEIIKLCKNLPGISILMPAAVVGANLKAMQKTSYELAKKAKLTKSKSFAIRAKRSEKSFKYGSKKMEEEIGAYIKEKSKAKVNLTKPSITVYVEALENKVLVSTEKIKGLGGLPVGVSGKIVCLMKDEDDLIAAFLFLRRGCEVISLHFRKTPREQQTFLNLLKKLNKFVYGSRIKTINVGGGFSMSLAEKLASHENAKALCLGSTKLEQKYLKAKLLVFTPLVGLSRGMLDDYKKLIFKKG